MPCLLSPAQVPPCGRRLEDELQQRRHLAAKAAEAAAKAAAQGTYRGDWDAGAVDSKPSPGLDGTSPDPEVGGSLVSRCGGHPGAAGRRGGA